MGTLFVVGTPIGNLEDITLRALRILGECDAIICEDTRVTKKLLSRYDISKPLIACHEHSREGVYGKVLALLEEGKHLALVTDAGTPSVSDPGATLVCRVREVLGGSVRIEAVPGPSALAAAISVAGIDAREVHFLGFLPHKKGRQTALRSLASLEGVVALYESPHRIVKLMGELMVHVPEKTVMLCRELTKVHEEVITGTPAEHAARFGDHPGGARGEFVVLIAPHR